MRITYKKINDEPDSKYDRKWQWSLNIKWNSISNDLELIQFEGKTCEPRPVRSHGIFLNWSWKFGSYHTYYDGDNCAWNFGPIHIYRHGLFNCKGCDKDHYS